MWTKLRGEFQAHQDMCQWPHQMAGKGGGVEGQEAPPTVDTIWSFLLTTQLTFCVSKLNYQDSGIH